MQLLPRRYHGKRVLKESNIHNRLAFVLIAVLMLSSLVAFTPVEAERRMAHSAAVNTTRVHGARVVAQHGVKFAKPEVIPEPTQSVKAWYVTTDEYSDSLGNASTISNFCTSEWASAKSYLQAHYVAAWPHGQVKDDRPPIDLGPIIGIAISANAMRESTCIPSTLQGTGNLSDSMGSGEVLSTLLSLGTSRGKAWGIIQWDGGRRYNFALFCKASDFDPRSLEAQLYYMAYEYYASSEYGSYSNLVSLYARSENTIENVKSAAEIFRAKVERGGSPHSADAILENWGNKWDATWGGKPSGGFYAYLTAQ